MVSIWSYLKMTSVQFVTKAIQQKKQSFSWRLSLYLLLTKTYQNPWETWKQIERKQTLFVSQIKPSEWLWRTLKL